MNLWELKECTEEAWNKFGFTGAPQEERDLLEALAASRFRIIGALMLPADELGREIDAMDEINQAVKVGYFGYL